MKKDCINEEYHVHIHDENGNILCGKINPKISFDIDSIFIFKDLHMELCKNCEEKLDNETKEFINEINKSNNEHIHIEFNGKILCGIENPKLCYDIDSVIDFKNKKDCCSDIAILCSRCETALEYCLSYDEYANVRDMKVPLYNIYDNLTEYEMETIEDIVILERIYNIMPYLLGNEKVKEMLSKTLLECIQIIDKEIKGIEIEAEHILDLDKEY